MSYLFPDDLDLSLIPHYEMDRFSLAYCIMWRGLSYNDARVLREHGCSEFGSQGMAEAEAEAWQEYFATQV